MFQDEARYSEVQSKLRDVDGKGTPGSCYTDWQPAHFRSWSLAVKPGSEPTKCAGTSDSTQCRELLVSGASVHCPAGRHKRGVSRVQLLMKVTKTEEEEEEEEEEEWLPVCYLALSLDCSENVPYVALDLAFSGRHDVLFKLQNLGGDGLTVYLHGKEASSDNRATPLPSYLDYGIPGTDAFLGLGFRILRDSCSKRTNNLACFSPKINDSFEVSDRNRGTSRRG